jgi:hypothetical protein
MLLRFSSCNSPLSRPREAYAMRCRLLGVRDVAGRGNWQEKRKTARERGMRRFITGKKLASGGYRTNAACGTELARNTSAVPRRMLCCCYSSSTATDAAE